MDNRIVIGSHAGGLGDHLLYSTLPELYRKASDRLDYKVYVNVDNARNPEMVDLVWKRNPYVTGITSDPPTHGNVFVGMDFIKLAKHIGPIRAVEQLHGFNYGLGDGSDETPRVYSITWWFNSEWDDKVVLDPRSISQGFTTEAIEAYVRHVARWFDFKVEDVIVLSSKHAGPSGAQVLLNNPFHVCKDIFEYAKIILHAKYFLGVQSGGSVLAAALRPKDTFALYTQMLYNDGIFTFPNVKYVITGGLTPDYHSYPGE